jgi:hypothetical protein
MANRFWVGGNGTWDATSTANWATTSGGSSGASAPTSADNVYFDASSGTGVTITCSNAVCASLDATGFTSGQIISSTVPYLTVYGNVVAGPATISNIVLSGTGSQTFNSSASVATIYLNSNGGTYSLTSSLTATSIYIQSGSFVTSNNSINCSYLYATGTATSSLTLGSSAVTCSTQITFSSGNNFTFNAGTSTITNLSSFTIDTRNTDSASRTFYDLSVSSGSLSVYGTNTFRNVTIGFDLTIYGNQTITGSLTLPAGTVSARQALVGGQLSPTRGVRRTLTVASLPTTPVYWDFSDVGISGAVSPLTGSYLGDRGNNTGITFPSAKTVYWVGGSATWASATTWALSSGGAASINNVPLPQDSITVDSNSGSSGSTITLTVDTNPYVTTVDFSARTVGTALFSLSSSNLYVMGNLVQSAVAGINSSSTSLTYFAGRGSQTITSSGRTTTCAIGIDQNNSSASLGLSDACSISTPTGFNLSNRGSLTLFYGRLNTNNYNLTIATTNSSAPSVYAVAWGGSAAPITIAIGTSTISMNRGFTNFIYSLQFTGTSTGKIQFTSTNAKTLAGGSLGSVFPTVDQAGLGTLTITGSAQYYNLINSYKATGATTVRFSAGKNTFNLFDLAGEAGRVCTLTSSVAPTRASLTLTSGAPINAGSTSTDAGNNSGVLFTGGSNGYLSVSYVNSISGQGGFFLV